MYAGCLVWSFKRGWEASMRPDRILVCWLECCCAKAVGPRCAHRQQFTEHGSRERGLASFLHKLCVNARRRVCVLFAYCILCVHCLRSAGSSVHQEKNTAPSFCIFLVAARCFRAAFCLFSKLRTG